MVSLALTRMGCEAIAIGYDPKEYRALASAYEVKATKTDPECNKFELPDSAVIALFSHSYQYA